MHVHREGHGYGNHRHRLGTVTISLQTDQGNLYNKETCRSNSMLPFSFSSFSIYRPIYNWIKNRVVSVSVHFQVMLIKRNLNAVYG